MVKDLFYTLANASPFLGNLFTASLKGSLLLIVALAANAWMKKASAAFRHLFLVSVIFSLLLFLVPAPLRIIKMPSISVRQIAVGAPWQTPIISRSVGLWTMVNDEGKIKAKAVSSPMASYFPSLILSIWLLGAAITLARLIIGVLAVQRIRRTASTLSVPEVGLLLEECKNRMGLQSSVTLLLGPPYSVPATSGLLRPFILLPSECETWSRERLSAVLWHELAHIKRHDVVTNGLAQVIATLYWFNPLVWYALKQSKTALEEACDDMVLHQMRSFDYADHLLEILRSCRFTSPFFATMGNISTIERRIRNILRKKKNISPCTSSMVWGLLPLMLVVISLTLFGPKNDVQAKSPIENTPSKTSSIQRNAFLWPLKGEISSPFGFRKDPLTTEEKSHAGIDIRTPMYTPVASAANGVVIETGFRHDYGRYVIISHAEGWTTLYAKLSQINVKRDQEVKSGEVIALSGNSGRSTGPHLHFEVRKDGRSMNPLDVLE